ncbi:intersectin-2b isoform X4 [Balamuthia mandrillaris]
MQGEAEEQKQEKENEIVDRESGDREKTKSAIDEQEGQGQTLQEVAYNQHEMNLEEPETTERQHDGTTNGEIGRANKEKEKEKEREPQKRTWQDMTNQPELTSSQTSSPTSKNTGAAGKMLPSAGRGGRARSSSLHKAATKPASVPKPVDLPSRRSESQTGPEFASFLTTHVATTTVTTGAGWAKGSSHPLPPPPTLTTAATADEEEEEKEEASLKKEAKSALSTSPSPRKGSEGGGAWGPPSSLSARTPTASSPSSSPPSSPSLRNSERATSQSSTSSVWNRKSPPTPVSSSPDEFPALGAKMEQKPTPAGPRLPPSTIPSFPPTQQPPRNPYPSRVHHVPPTHEAPPEQPMESWRRDRYSSPPTSTASEHGKPHASRHTLPDTPAGSYVGPSHSTREIPRSNAATQPAKSVDSFGTQKNVTMQETVQTSNSTYRSRETEDDRTTESDDNKIDWATEAEEGFDYNQLPSWIQADADLSVGDDSEEAAEDSANADDGADVGTEAGMFSSAVDQTTEPVPNEKATHWRADAAPSRQERAEVRPHDLVNTGLFSSKHRQPIVQDTWRNLSPNHAANALSLMARDRKEEYKQEHIKLPEPRRAEAPAASAPSDKEKARLRLEAQERELEQAKERARLKLLKIEMRLEEKKKKEEEERRKAEEEKRRQEEEHRRLLAEEQKRKEEERKRLEEERKRKEQEELVRKKADLEARRREEEARRLEAQRKDEELKKQQREEERRREQELLAQKAEEIKRQQEEAQRRHQEERRKREEERRAAQEEEEHRRRLAEAKRIQRKEEEEQRERERRAAAQAKLLALEKKAAAKREQNAADQKDSATLAQQGVEPSLQTFGAPHRGAPIDPQNVRIMQRPQAPQSSEVEAVKPITTTAVAESSALPPKAGAIPPRKLSQERGRGRGAKVPYRGKQRSIGRETRQRVWTPKADTAEDTTLPIAGEPDTNRELAGTEEGIRIETEPGKEQGVADGSPSTQNTGENVETASNSTSDAAVLVAEVGAEKPATTGEGQVAGITSFAGGVVVIGEQHGIDHSYAEDPSLWTEIQPKKKKTTASQADLHTKKGSLPRSQKGRRGKGGTSSSAKPSKSRASLHAGPSSGVSEQSAFQKPQDPKKLSAPSPSPWATSQAPVVSFTQIQAEEEKLKTGTVVTISQSESLPSGNVAEESTLPAEPQHKEEGVSTHSSRTTKRNPKGVEGTQKYSQRKREGSTYRKKAVSLQTKVDESSSTATQTQTPPSSSPLIHQQNDQHHQQQNPASSVIGTTSTPQPQPQPQPHQPQQPHARKQNGQTLRGRGGRKQASRRGLSSTHDRQQNSYSKGGIARPSTESEETPFTRPTDGLPTLPQPSIEKHHDAAKEESVPQTPSRPAFRNHHHHGRRPPSKSEGGRTPLATDSTRHDDSGPEVSAPGAALLPSPQVQPHTRSQRYAKAGTGRSRTNSGGKPSRDGSSRSATNESAATAPSHKVWRQMAPKDSASSPSRPSAAPSAAQPPQQPRTTAISSSNVS